MDKEALTLSNARVLKGMGVGALGGAAAGAAGGAATAEEGKGVSGALKGALGGAAGGAALGAGAGWAVPRVQAGMKSGLTLGQSIKAVGQDARARVMPTARSASPASSPARPVPAASANPTLADNQWVSSHYRALPESTRKMVEANPLVAQHGMSPEMAWQLQEMSRGQQSLGTFAARASLPQATSAGAGAAAGAATVAPGMRSAATNAGTVGRPYVDAATVAPGMRKAAYLLKNIGVEPKVRPLSAFSPKDELRTVKKASMDRRVTRVRAVPFEQLHPKHQALVKEHAPGKDSYTYFDVLDAMGKTAMIPSAGQGLKAAQKSMQSASQRLVKSQGVGVPSFKMPAPKPLNKIGFAQSAYSGPLSDGNSTKYESYIPPFRNPPVKTAGPPSEDKKADVVKTSAMLDEMCKLNNVISSQGQLTKTKKVGAPKASAPPGPSIQQVAKPVGFGTPIAGATKGSI